MGVFTIAVDGFGFSSDRVAFAAVAVAARALAHGAG